MEVKKKTTFNPKWIELADSYRALQGEVEKVNPFLAGLVEDTRLHFSTSRGTFGFKEGRTMLRAFINTDIINEVTNAEDLNKKSDQFFKIADYFKKEGEDGNGYRGFHSLVIMYRYLYKSGILTDLFCIEDKSPKTLINKGRLEEFLKNEYISSDKTFLVEMRKGYPCIFTLDLRAQFLADYAVKALSHSRSTWRQNHNGIVIGRDLTVWYDSHGEQLRSYKDMNGERFAALVEHVLKTYHEKQDLAQAMYFVFDIYQQAIYDHPKHNFFEDSLVWNSQMIMDQFIPMNIAGGYKMIFMGQDKNIPAYDKVLFCSTGMNHRYANAHRLGSRAVDLTQIKSDLYKRIVINFISSTAYTDYNRFNTLFCFLEKRKKGRDLDYIDRHDLNAYHKLLTTIKSHGKPLASEARNSYVSRAVGILQWAEDNKFIRIEDGAWDNFKFFKCIIRPNPKAIPKEWLPLIRKGLVILAANGYMGKIALWIFDLQLFGDTRPGQICNTDIGNLTYNATTGTMEGRAVEKNSYGNKVRIMYSTRQTRILEEIIEESAQVRAKCPVDGPVNNLFVYQCGKYHNYKFRVFTIETYNRYLKKASEMMGLPKIVSGNIRDTYMTIVSRHARKNGLNDLQRMVLTHHRRKVSTNAYVELDLDIFLEQGNSINVGHLKRLDGHAY